VGNRADKDQILDGEITVAGPSDPGGSTKSGGKKVRIPRKIKVRQDKLKNNYHC